MFKSKWFRIGLMNVGIGLFNLWIVYAFPENPTILRILNLSAGIVCLYSIGWCILGYRGEKY